jgi:hypothetical protein
MTISVEENVYNTLHPIADAKKINEYLAELIRPPLSAEALEAGYKAMAADADHEQDALEWCNAIIGDCTDA